MQQWELTKIYVPLEIQARQKLFIADYYPVNGAEAQKAWKEAEKLAGSGWELVSTVPLNTGYQRSYAGLSVTQGYVLIFKRPIP